MYWRTFLDEVSKGKVKINRQILPHVEDQKPEELLRNFFWWLESGGLIFGMDEQEAAKAMHGACECALAAVKTAAIRAGAKEAGWCDTNGNWPLHDMLAKALQKADRASCGTSESSSNAGCEAHGNR